MLKGSNLRGAGSPRLTRFRDGRLATRPSIHKDKGDTNLELGTVGRSRTSGRSVLETAALPQLDRVHVSGQDGWFRATDLVLPTHARYLCATS